MTGRLAGKRAIVTAAAQGIGRESAIRFAQEGALVTALDIDEEGLAALATETGCAVHHVDLTEPVALARFADSAPPHDIVFACAGYVASGTILDCDDRDWTRSLDLNVTSMYRLLRALLPGMIARGGGSIVTMASVASSVRGVADRFAYGTTKAAVIGLTKAIAADFVGAGIRANAICPGTVDTPSLQERLRATGDYATARAAFEARQPMGRLGQAAEIAELALYLASDAAAFTTGQIHVIDGGWTN